MVANETVLTDEALFRSDGGALKFALNFSHGACKKPSLTTLMAGGGKPGRGLAGLDGAGQAGMIRAQLDRLSKVRRCILIARHAVQMLPCACRQPCCRGYRENIDWTDAIDGVAEFLLISGVTGTVSHYQLRRALARRFFGDTKVSFTQIATACKVNRDTASSYMNKASELLKAEEKLAKYEVEGILKEAGIVE